MLMRPVSKVNCDSPRRQGLADAAGGDVVPVRARDALDHTVGAEPPQVGDS